VLWLVFLRGDGSRACWGAEGQAGAETLPGTSQGSARAPTRPPPPAYCHTLACPPTSQAARKEGKEQPAIYPGHCLTCLRGGSGVQTVTVTRGFCLRGGGGGTACPSPAALPSSWWPPAPPRSWSVPYLQDGLGAREVAPPPPLRIATLPPPSCAWTRAPARTSLDLSAKMPGCQTGHQALSDDHLTIRL